MKVAKPLREQQPQELQRQLKAQRSEDVKFDPRPPPASLTRRMMVAKRQMEQQQELQRQQKVLRSEEVKFDPRPPPASLKWCEGSSAKGNSSRSGSRITG